MKKVILFFAMIFPIAMYAQKGKYIKKYDVLQYLTTECDRQPSTFWKMIAENNTEFRNTMKKFDNPKGSAKKAKERVGNSADMMKSLRDMRDFTPAEEEQNAKVRKMMFGEGDNYGMMFGVSNDDEWNAYCTPDGYVNVNIGLINRLGRDPEMLCGVIAHEVCHYIYRHMLIHEYKSLKKEKQNMIGAAIGAAGTAIGNVAAASAGLDKDYSADQYTSYFDIAREQSELSRYKYSREEEIEADIVAYRFMEWIGANPMKYIEALARINLDNLTGNNGEKSNHPSTTFRMDLLRDLRPAPFRR